MSDLFYVFGIALTVAALIVSFVGLRMEKFPTGRGAFAGVVALFAVLVLGTTAYAVVLAREEQEHRAEELAHEAEQAEAEGAEEAEGEESAADPEAEAVAESGEQQGEAVQPEEGEAAGGKETLLELTSPESGDLIFEPDALEAPAGTVTLEYTNPSPVPHNVAIESSGETVAEGEVVTGGDVSEASFGLEPGSYVFYCAVPGHREGGMEGELTVE